MQIDQKIVARLNELIETGKTLEKTIHSIQGGYTYDSDGATQLRVSSLSFLGKVFGRDSEHYQALNSLQRHHGGNDILKKNTVILLAAKDDYVNGYLFDLHSRITADVFDDFLEQAEYLLNDGYFQPAAVMAGAVLEDGLRKMCERYPEIEMPDKPALDWMNGQLAKSGAYTKLTQKRVTVLADLRNKAAHGKWDEFSKPDVDRMLPDVRDFMEKHFSD